MISMTVFEVSAAGRTLGILFSEGAITAEEARRQGQAFVEILNNATMTRTYINGFRRAMAQYDQMAEVTESILHSE